LTSAKEFGLSPNTEPRRYSSCRNPCVVDADERLTLKDGLPGRSEAQLAGNTEQVCIVRSVEVKAGKPYAFSIGDSDLTHSSKRRTGATGRASIPMSEGIDTRKALRACFAAMVPFGD
jgi:hypothetical protein